MDRPSIEVAVLPEGERTKQVAIHHLVVAGHVAAFAMDLAKVGSFSPSIADGDDTNGGVKYRLMTPDELVTRSMEIASLIFERCDNLGWTQPVPSLETLRDSGGRAGFLEPK